MIRLPPAGLSNIHYLLGDRVGEKRRLRVKDIKFDVIPTALVRGFYRAALAPELHSQCEFELNRGAAGKEQTFSFAH
jgi:hypothetical protein